MKNDINEHAIQLIRERIMYIKEYGYIYGWNLEWVSFSKWAAIEIIKRLKTQTDLPPLVILGAFKDEMYMYACSNESPLFSIAIDVANDIDDLLTDS